MQGLQQLNLAENQLSSLPTGDGSDFGWRSLDQLQELWLYSNRLTQLLAVT